MSENKFKRVIGRLGVAALAINGLIGAGIFALPSAAAGIAGLFSPWMFLLCSLLMATILLCFAQLSAGFDDNGGPVAYTERAFGHQLAFQTTWLLYIGRVTALAANANALVFYLSQFFVMFAEPLYKGIAIVFILCSLGGVNIFNAAKAMRIIHAITLIKLAPLLLFIGFGIPYLTAEIFDLATIEQVTDFDGALLLLIYAYIGFEGAVVPAGETKNPKQQIAKALIATLLATSVLYFFIQWVSVSAITELSASKTPMSDVAYITMGQAGLVIMTLAAIFSISGNLTVVIFTASRMTQSLAQLGQLPTWFAKSHDVENSPIHSTYFLVVLAGGLALTGSFVWLAIISSLARLIGFVISIAALIKLHDDFKQAGHWFLPAGKILPLVSLLVCGWLSIQASVTSWLMTGLFMLLGFALFHWNKRVQ
ncbi:amino acid permease [Thalassotalea sp. LPB0316]|uniref:APC family permease n=1 Tax=Thalassotalea sp. LPB0316 TaxID=2769490 RepID=UPI001867E8E5|nr:APC family permease [Thalassotalea sp. LPB0316]QOL24786.1 amino acid permease [Thalassotalea sp. LPB0316]